MTVLKLETLAWVRELPSGDVLAAPAADLARACVGEEEIALLELRSFLTDHLAKASPEEVARHVLPGNARLEVTRVLVPRPDLPRRFALDTPIDITSLVLPVPAREGRAHKNEAWVVIIPLAHTFFLRDGEELHEVVKSETTRLIAAVELPLRDYLGLLPGADESLEPIELEPAFGEEGPGGRAASLRRALLAHERRKAAVKVLESVATPMHTQWEADREHGRPLRGRDAEFALLTSLLSGKVRLSCALVGAARSGKSALFKRYWEHAKDHATAPLVYATSGAQLIAGMSGLGQWQERVRRVMDAAAELDAILFFDDLADLFAEHGQSVIDLAGAMKPYVEEGRVRLVGELHPDRLDFIESRSPSFFAALNRVRLEPLQSNVALEALRAQIAFDRKRYPDEPTLADEAIAPLIDLVDRYLPYQVFPGKAVGLYRDLVTARARESRTDPVSESDLFDAMSLRTGVPAFLLRDDRSLLLADVVTALGSRVVGQAEAVRSVAETLCVVKARLQPPGKPLATFFFVGPTGVGKTELARSLAAYLFGSESRLLRLDMSEYTDPQAASRLFRGVGRHDGVLTRKIREQPFSVVLLDEIEKAHPSVLDVLLQVFGEGRLTDARGRTAFFHDAILVLTSNVGTQTKAKPIGIDTSSARTSPVTAHFVKAVEQSFRPELVNRIDRVVVFSPLGDVEARRVVELVVDRVRIRRGLIDDGVELSLSEKALDHLALHGFSREYGARSLRRYVEEHLVAPLAELCAGAAATVPRARILTHVEDEESPRVDPAFVTVGQRARAGLVVRLDRRVRAGAARDVAGVEGVSAIRRELASQLELNPIVALREQVQLLVTQMDEAARAASKRSKQKPKAKPTTVDGRARSMTELMTEHHRLSSLLTRLDKAYADVLDLEELSIVALFEGHAFTELISDVRAARSSFRMALGRALVALEPKRDTAMLLLHELDGGRPLDLYLLPMIREAKRLGWTVQAHFPDEKLADWPADRRFGPAQNADVIRARFADGKQRPRSILVSVMGNDAGVFMALECGVHRYRRVAANLTETRLMVELIALRPTLTDEEWKRPVIAPLGIPDTNTHKRARPTRDLDAADESLVVLDDAATLPIGVHEYWPRFEEIVLEHLLLCEGDDRFSRGSFLSEGIARNEGTPADDEEAG